MRDEPESSSSNKTILIVVSIIAGVILVIVASCFGLGYFFLKAISPAMSSAMQMVNDLQQATATGQQFMADVAADRIDAAYEHTTKDFQKRQDLEAFRKFVAKHPGLKGNLPNFTNMQPLQGRCTMAFTITGPNGAVTGTLVVIKEGEEWKVDQFTIP
jgi:ABC-type antimicrobial peptide transport system permease subunit